MRNFSRPRRAVTLLELLIVITILLMVTAAAIPIMAPAVQNRRMREASRLVSSYVSSARARAIETGRSAGVMIERVNGQGYAMNLSTVETPQPYAGDSTNSLMVVKSIQGAITSAGNNGAGQIRITTAASNTLQSGLQITISGVGGTTEANGTWTVTRISATQFDLQASAFVHPYTSGGAFAFCWISPPYGDTQWMGLIRYGDLVRLDHRGPLYMLSSGVGTPDRNAGKAIAYAPSDPPWPNGPGTAWQLVPSSTGSLNLPPAYSTAGTTYQIYRQAQRSSVAPLQLPEGVVIDLVASGVGLTDLTFNSGAGTFNPVINFTPGGAVDSVTATIVLNAAMGIRSTPAPMRATGPIFLLVGRRDLMSGVSQSGGDENVFDPASSQHLANFWVSIGNQTGHVAVTENMGTNVATSRAFAAQAQSTGGR